MAILLLGTTIGGYAAIHAGNIASQSVNYANTSGSTTGNANTSNSLTVLGNNVSWNANTMGLGRYFNYASGGYWVNGPSGATYGSMYNLGGTNSSELSLQLVADVNHNSTSSTKDLWFRTGNNLGFQNDWKQVIHSGNIGSQSVLYATTAGALTSMNISQFTNNSGYLTAETDTLASVTSRGATTASQMSFTKVDDHAISVGTIRGRAVGVQTGEFIQLYERVNIGGPSGWGAANTAAPSYGLSVYGGANIGYGNNDSLFAYAYRGNGNVSGTGEASWHPAGIYSSGNMWQYGSLYKNNTGMYGVSEIQLNAGLYLQTYNDRNLIVKGNSSSDAGIEGRNAAGNNVFQIYGSGSDYGFLNGTWAAWDIRKTKNGALYMNDTSGYYLYTNGTSNFYALNIQGNAVVHAGNIGSQSVLYATTAGSAPNGSNINNYYDATAGNGFGFRFWNGSDSYKISMGSSSLYYYGPVTDYSIKMQMDNGSADRGFTWGRHSFAPIAALNSTSGDMQIAGSFTANLIIKSGGTSSQFLKADGTVDSTAYVPPSRTLTINGVTQDLSASRSFTVTASDPTKLPLSGGTLTGALIGTSGVFTSTLRGRKSQTNGDYTTAALWTESYDDTTTGIAFHISGVLGKFLEMRMDGILYWHGSQVVTNSGTWAINVTGSAGSISGYNNPAVAATGSTIVYRDPSGHIYGYYGFYSYINTTDDISTGAITHIIAKFGDNYHRSATAAKVQTFLGLGSMAYASTSTYYLASNPSGYISSETDTLASVTNRANSTAQDIVFTNGRKGLVGVYNAAQTQAIFAMGPAYTLTDGGGSATIGNIYGLAWSYDPGYGGAGNNPQSKTGLEHQLLVMANGITRTAIGIGVWTSGNITAANFTGSHTGTSSGINTGDQTSVSGNAGTVTNGVYTNVTNTIVNGDAAALILYGGTTYNAAAALYLGGWSTDTTYARIRTSNGNLHLDSRGATGYDIYFNHYSGGDMYFGYGGGTVYIYGGRLRHQDGTPYITNSGTWGISTTGNAATATYATNAGNANTIDDWGFRNTGSNSATAPDTIDSNGISYTYATVLGQTDGALYSQRHSTPWQHQIFGDYRTGQIAVRGKNAGTWQAWRTVLDSTNYVNYAWPLEGSWKPTSLSAETRLRGATSPDGGEFGLAYSSGQVYAYVDGFFYQNEGAYRVIDTNSVGSYAATPDHTHGLGRHSLAAPANIDGLTATNFRNTLFGSASNTWNISTARWNTTPTGLSGMNSYGTMLAWSGSDTHGFIAVDYSTANIQVGGGSADNITWKATLIHSGNIGSQSVSLASQVTINYNNNTNSTYQLLWGSGNSVYGTSGIYVNPNTDIIYSSGGYVSPGNAWGTNDSAFFPNGITTAGGDNWVYGHTYIAAAPSGGAGHEYWIDGSEYHKTTVSTVAHGQSGKWLTTQSAGGNYVPYSFEASNGDHSYGIIARFHIAGNLGSDRPSIMFSSGYSSTRWNIGYCYYDDQFRVTQNMGLAPNGTDGTWGSERFRIDTSGNTYAAIGGTLYANGSAVVTSANIGSQSVSYATTAGSAAYASNAGNADTVDGYSAVQLYTNNGSYLGGHYVSGGTELPNSTTFGAGKLKLAMLSGTTLGFGGSWNDVLWLSAYSGGDVKSSHALVFDKYSSDVWVADQNFDSATWGTGYKLLSTANYTSYSPSLTGSGASGTWGISITGNSATTSQRSFSGDISTSGMGRFTGWYNGNAAEGLATEIGVSGGQGYVIAYNRATSAYGTLNLESTNSNLRISGSTVNVTSGTLQQGGNQVLHAANYNSYAPTLTGTGASGSWAISITGSSGSVAWGNITSKPDWMTSASLVASHSNANSQVNSGFYENAGGGTNWPSATWYNSINVRHSNQGNYHGFQIAMSYYDNILWFRSYKGTGTFETWAYAISSANIASQSVAYATDAGTLSGYANTTFVGKNGNTYYQADTWIQMNTYAGLYWPSYYGAHLQANDLSNYTQLAIRGTKGGYSGIYDLNSGVHGIMYDAAGNGGIYRQASTKWYLYYNLGNSCMGINGTTTSISYGMYVTGAIYSTGDIVAYSDVRKKTDIVTIDSAISKVKEMRGVFYTRIDDEESIRQVGVIAQEMNEVLPEAVTYASDIDEYGVKYGNIVGVLIEAIKEQQKEIDELKAKLN